MAVCGLPYGTSPFIDNGTGVRLITQYAFCLDPYNPSSGLPQATVVGGNLQIKYYSSAAGVTYTPETSTDLVNWTSTGVTVYTPIMALDLTVSTGGQFINGYVSTASVPFDGSHPVYLRVRIDYSPPNY
jgi:hypothetical protein